MLFIYNISVLFYYLAIRLAALFQPKARLWLKGRKQIFQQIQDKLKDNTQAIIWFHTASLGEFEQGRPVIEQLRNKFRIQNSEFRIDRAIENQQTTEYCKILITFFSPSGYEVRKNYEEADYVFYLPLDTRKNAKQFLKLVKPKAVFFVKYEFWLHYLNEVQKRKIPLILFSAVFRKEQFFFRWYGGIFRKLLKGFTHIFVQNEFSKRLLESIGVQNVSLAGDTRFDRVLAHRENALSIPSVENFKNKEKLLVIGSSWDRDLAVLIPFLNEFELPLKVIIAPHEIKERTLIRLEKELRGKTIRFSQAKTEGVDSLKNHKTLLIDNVGMLSSLYQYGEFAYIGGAFGEGLHNILEPAVFEIPVLFGKDYRNFPEAADLIYKGGAFSIQNKTELRAIFLKLYSDEKERQKAGKICLDYIVENKGGADKICNFYMNNLP